MSEEYKIIPPDWEEHCREVIDSLSNRLQNDDDFYKSWISSKKRFLLVSMIKEVDGEFTAKSGKVTGYVESFIYSDKLEVLSQLWKDFLLKHYDTTTTHFIIDTRTRKVVEFLSICI